MSHKKHLYNNLYLFIISMIFIVGFNIFYIINIDEYSSKFFKLKEKSKIEIINVGSSHGFYGFKYPENINGVNLALPSQPFYYDYKILKKYLPQMSKNERGIVLIPISIFSFYFVDNFSEFEKQYYGILNYNEIYKKDLKQYIFFKYFYFISRIKGTCKFVLMSMKNKKLNVNSEVKYPKDLLLKEKIIEAERTSERHLGLDKNSLQRKDPQKGINELIRIINLTKEYNLQPILITTPQSYLYNLKINENDYKEKIYKNIKKISNHFKEPLIYLDYSHDEEFTKNLEYFFDDDHLNEKGAKKFTKKLINDLDRIKGKFTR